MNQAEFRSAALSVSGAEDQQTVEGYAAVFNTPTILYSMDGIDFYETVDAGAFDGADVSNVVLRYNHSDNFQILARTSNDTLRISADAVGLKIEADIANTTQGRDIYELIRRKDITKMSYGYIIDKSYYEKVSELKYIRHVSKIGRVIDVSVVDLPAYDTTHVEVVNRSSKGIKDEFLNIKRKKIELKSKI